MAWWRESDGALAVVDSDVLMPYGRGRKANRYWAGFGWTWAGKERGKRGKEKKLRPFKVFLPFAYSPFSKEIRREKRIENKIEGHFICTKNNYIINTNLVNLFICLTRKNKIGFICLVAKLIGTQVMVT